MENNNIKLAFAKVKEDILFLGNEISALKFDFSAINSELYYLSSSLSNLVLELSEIKSMLKHLHEQINTQKLNNLVNIADFENSTDNPTNQQTIQHTNPTRFAYPTHNPTVPQEIKGLKSQNIGISTGNEGVPTNRQTNTQTDKQTDKYPENPVFKENLNAFGTTIESNIKKASEILDSLDRLKKEIRLKFKRLTNQEMTVFSTVYQLEEQDPENTTYRKVAQNLKLSESSIRDYIQRIISKGIPIKKQKIDNKKILLSISGELKKIATLSTIIKLREL